MIKLPAIILPAEFLQLLKDPSAATAGLDAPVPIFLRRHPGLGLVLSRAFTEFDEHSKGLEKVFATLGWAHFRDRMASVYLFKAINGAFPQRTDMDLVDDVIKFETRFRDQAVAGPSRLFMLGMYLKLLNIHRSQLDDAPAADVTVPPAVDRALAVTQGRSERPDWLVVLCWHFDAFLGTEAFLAALKDGKTYGTLYGQLKLPQQQLLVENLLSYGSSIQESDPFVYERI
jgi:hypothetical protein